MAAIQNAPKFAVYHVERHWLIDTCAGGTWNETVEEACWFDTIDEAREALRAAEIVPKVAWSRPEIIPDGIVICRVR